MLEGPRSAALASATCPGCHSRTKSLILRESGKWARSAGPARGMTRQRAGPMSPTPYDKRQKWGSASASRSMYGAHLHEVSIWVYHGCMCCPANHALRLGGAHSSKGNGVGLRERDGEGQICLEIVAIRFTFRREPCRLVSPCQFAVLQRRAKPDPQTDLSSLPALGLDFHQVPPGHRGNGWAVQLGHCASNIQLAHVVHNPSRS